MRKKVKNEVKFKKKKKKKHQQQQQLNYLIEILYEEERHLGAPSAPIYNTFSKSFPIDCFRKYFKLLNILAKLKKQSIS